MGNLQKAKSILELVVPRRQKKYNVDHSSSLHAECTLALVYWKLGDTVEATKIYEQVMQTFAKFLKPNRKRRLEIEYYLASCYYELRRYKESLRLAESIQGYMRNVPGKPWADFNNKLIRLCLKAIKLEKVSDRDESVQEGQNEVEDGDDVAADEL